jgi:hypothetical protein
MHQARNSRVIASSYRARDLFHDIETIVVSIAQPTCSSSWRRITVDHSTPATRSAAIQLEEGLDYAPLHLLISLRVTSTSESLC